MDYDFINPYLEKQLANTLDDNRMKELKKVIRFLNSNNPYDEKISWLDLLSNIFKKIKNERASLHDNLINYIKK